MDQHKKKGSIPVLLACILCLGLAGCGKITDHAENEQHTKIAAESEAYTEIAAGLEGDRPEGADTAEGEKNMLPAVNAPDGERYVSIIADEVLIIEDVIYRTVSEETLALDIYMPKEEEPPARPAVILLHSGGMTEGDKKDDVLIQNLSEDLAGMGYVVFNVNYRLADEEESYREAVEKASADITEAFHWIEEQAESYSVDPQSIAVGGYSAGASVAINTCYGDDPAYDIDPEAILGVIDLAGGNTFYGDQIRGSAPCLIIHGDADTTVPYHGSEIMQYLLEDAGTACELYTLEGLNHTLTTRYDEIRNKIAMFLYEQLTGEKAAVDIKAEVSLEYLNVEMRENNGIEYPVRQISCVLDGKLDEWTDCQEIQLSELKDVGEMLPDAADFSGTAYIGWNEDTPGILYIAAKIRDDILVDGNDEDGKWYNDDCLEIIFDLSADGVAEQLMKWVIGAGAVDMAMLADSDNTQVSTTTEQDMILYEIAIDLNKIDSGIRQIKTPVSFEKGMKIGFSIAYNDCENGERQHQIGWTKGKSSDRTTFGNLIFQ